MVQQNSKPTGLSEVGTLHVQIAQEVPEPETGLVPLLLSVTVTLAEPALMVTGGISLFLIAGDAGPFTDVLVAPIRINAASPPREGRVAFQANVPYSQTLAPQFASPGTYQVKCRALAHQAEWEAGLRGSELSVVCPNYYTVTGETLSGLDDAPSEQTPLM